MIINVVIVSIVSRLIIFFYNLDEGTFAHESSHNTNASSEHPVIRHPHRLRHISSIINLANYTYESMKKERGQVQSPVTLQYGANWPCVWGEEVVGALDKLQSGKHDDGWKFTCGLRLLEPPCVIYSLGSNGNMVFEKNVLMINPSCSIHIFDRDQYDTSPWFNNSVIDSGKVQFHRMFVTDAPDKLNAHANPPVLNLRHIMTMLNHTHIDILKLDIEGKEWNLLQAGDFPSFGQIQLEIHEQQRETIAHRHAVMHNMVTNIERNGLRLFHKESNPFCTICTEFAFIQKNWHPLSKNYSLPMYSSP